MGLSIFRRRRRTACQKRHHSTPSNQQLVYVSHRNTHFSTLRKTCLNWYRRALKKITGKPCLTSDKKHTPQSCYLIFVGFFTLSACTTSPSISSFNDSSPSEIDEIQTLFNTKDVHTCKNTDKLMDVRGRIQSAKLFWTEKNQARLIYQAAFRDEVKSVFQPIKDDFSATSEGIRLGPKSSSAVADFEIMLDSFKNTWTSFRFQPNNQSPFTGLVEFVGQGDSIRKEFRVPVANNETTVTKLWLVESRKKGLMHVIVRTSRIDFSKTTSDSGIYSWFIVDVKESKMTLSGTFKNERENLESVTFMSHPTLDEPIAFGIEQQSLDEEATTKTARKSSFQVVARRIFSPRKEVSIIQKTSHIITQLDATLFNSKETGVAWLREDPTNGGQTNVEWTVLKTDSLFATMSRVSARKIESVLLNYTVNNIALSSLQENWNVSLHATAANRQAVLLLPVYKQNKPQSAYLIPPSSRILSTSFGHIPFRVLLTPSDKRETTSQPIHTCLF